MWARVNWVLNDLGNGLLPVHAKPLPEANCYELSLDILRVNLNAILNKIENQNYKYIFTFSISVLCELPISCILYCNLGQRTCRTLWHISYQMMKTPRANSRNKGLTIGNTSSNGEKNNLCLVPNWSSIGVLQNKTKFYMQFYTISYLYLIINSLWTTWPLLAYMDWARWISMDK